MRRRLSITKKNTPVFAIRDSPKAAKGWKNPFANSSMVRKQALRQAFDKQVLRVGVRPKTRTDNPMPKLFWVLLLWLGISACNSLSTDERIRPNATGREFELVVVTDSVLDRNDTLRSALQAVFARPFPGLPQREAWFKLNFLPQDKLDNYTKRHKSLLFLDTGRPDSEIRGLMDQIYGQEKMMRLRSDDDRVYLAAEDVWAKPQRVSFLFADSKEGLLGRLRRKDSALVALFHQNELENLRQVVYKTEEQEALAARIRRKHGLGLRVPINFKLAKSYSRPKNAQALDSLGLNELVWLRSETRETSNHILLYSQPYRSQAQLEQDSSIALRSQVGKQFIPGPKKGSYMWTETVDYLPESDIVDFNGMYAREIRGLWEVEGDFMGGPFLHYTILDEAHQRVIHLDGFVYAPGTNKKPFVARLEVILHTLTIAEEQETQTASGSGA